MDFNTMLTRFGFNSTNFVNKPVNAIEFEGGFIYEVEEAYSQCICPNCNHQFMFVHSSIYVCPLI